MSACIFVAGCGGGGGEECAVRTSEECFSEAEYTARVASVAGDIRSTPGFEDRWGLEAINVPEAWAHLRVVRGAGKPGLGVTVGVIDTGIDLDHPTFREGAAAGEVTEEFRLDAMDETGEEFSHGTGVASVIAGRANPRDALPFTGIAPYAKLRMFAIPLEDPPPPDHPFTPVELSELAPDDEQDAEFYREVLSRDLDVLNLSFGVLGLVENYGDAPALRAALPRTIEALAQSGREDKTILVWAAGNSHEILCSAGTDNCEGDTETDHLGRPAGLLNASSPSLFAGLTAHIEELRGHSIAAVATGEDGGIAFFSNRCGIAADWCIAAPGFDVWAAYFGPYEGEVIRDYARVSGTSLAAPMVSGGLALMRQFFRDQLPSGELVSRLFRTADRSGRYADRSVYGQGLMDLDAALSPVGEPMIAMESVLSGDGVSVRQTSLRLGMAFGDGPTRALSQQEIAGFDMLGAPFWYDLGHLVVPSALPALGAEIREFMAAPPIERRAGSVIETNEYTSLGGLRLGIGETSAGTAAGHAAVAGDALTFTIAQPDGVAATAFTTEGVGDRQPASGAVMSWHPRRAPFGLRAGWLGERKNVLSGAAEGAFGDLAADSVFVGLDLDLETDGWHLSGGPELGVVRPHVRGGLITDMAPLTTSAFELHASRPTAGNGTLQVSLSQPLRVEDGDAGLSVPVGRTQDREIVRRQFVADLVPMGRQLDLSVRWDRPLAAGVLRLGAVATRHAGHDAGAPPRLSLLAGWRTSF